MTVIINKATKEFRLVQEETGPFSDFGPPVNGNCIKDWPGLSDAEENRCGQKQLYVRTRWTRLFCKINQRAEWAIGGGVISYSRTDGAISLSASGAPTFRRASPHARFVLEIRDLPPSPPDTPLFPLEPG